MGEARRAYKGSVFKREGLSVQAVKRKVEVKQLMV